MKILCVCKQGIVRSGALAWLLRLDGHDALSVGYETNAIETIRMVCGWADLIIALDNASYHSITLEFVSKSWTFDVGEDRWHNPADPELHSILRKMISERL